MSAALVRATSLLEALQQQPLTRFFVVGMVVTAVDFGVFNALVLMHGEPSTAYILFANTIAFAIAANVGYQLHSRFTFRVGREWRSFWAYVAVAVIGVTIYNSSLLALLWLIGSDHPIALNIAKLGAVGFASTWNFQGFRLLAFRPREARAAR